MSELPNATLTQQLSQLVVNTAPTSEARALARAGLLDFVAVSLPIVQGDIADTPLKSLQQVYCADDAQTRALLLGYAGHALDFDDFHPDFRGHPTTVILPVLFALAQGNAEIAGDAFLDAYIIGVETAGRLGLAAGPQHYKAGYHSTATLGSIAAAAAAARLAGATVEQTANILGIAATRASGLRAQFGSVVKPLHAGFAAESAVIASRLALAGFEGQPDGVLEAFLASGGGGQQRPEKLTSDWGAPWRIVSPGLEFKPYPTCAGTHSAADAAFILRAEWLEKSEKTPADLFADIESIEVSFPPGGDIAASVTHPHSRIEARFSLEYVIAATLLHNRLSLSDFGEGPVDDGINALAGKVSRSPDMTAPPDEIDPTQRFHQVTLSRKNGEQLTCRVTRQQSVAKGVDLRRKLESCLSLRSPQAWDEIEVLCQLGTPGALSELAKRLTSFQT
ncbi:immunity protein [Rouxiella silvae]|uniref:Immunity protein n=1 Tax=Rouxiella silvae TaxID=1646373 RepID=A0ABX3TXF5_9GAMM|nr:MmgE/PrpD family protein [Rouxiella silvae]ORJ19926.1 immunity protein [Rouxiella silvae]